MEPITVTTTSSVTVTSGCLSCCGSSSSCCLYAAALYGDGTLTTDDLPEIYVSVPADIYCQSLDMYLAKGTIGLVREDGTSTYTGLAEFKSSEGDYTEYTYSIQYDGSKWTRTCDATHDLDTDTQCLITTDSLGIQVKDQFRDLYYVTFPVSSGENGTYPSDAVRSSLCYWDGTMVDGYFTIYWNENTGRWNLSWTATLGDGTTWGEIAVKDGNQDVIDGTYVGAEYGNITVSTGAS